MWPSSNSEEIVNDVHCLALDCSMESSATLNFIEIVSLVDYLSFTIRWTATGPTVGSPKDE